MKKKHSKLRLYRDNLKDAAVCCDLPPSFTMPVIIVILFIIVFLRTSIVIIIPILVYIPQCNECKPRTNATVTLELYPHHCDYTYPNGQIIEKKGRDKFQITAECKFVVWFVPLMLFLVILLLVYIIIGCLRDEYLKSSKTDTINRWRYSREEARQGTYWIFYFVRYIIRNIPSYLRVLYEFFQTVPEILMAIGVCVYCRDGTRVLLLSL